MQQQQQGVISVMLIVVVVVFVFVRVPSTIPTMDKNTILDHLNPQYNHIPLPVLQMCQELNEILMIDVFGKSHFPWQKAIITHLNLMTCPTSGIPPSPTFLCAPTGGGKLIARDYFVAEQGNISWCILPLLSLGADQVIKINQNLAPGNGAVVAFHIDHYRLPSTQQWGCLSTDCTDCCQASALFSLQQQHWRLLEILA
jgi:hypothetical protein